MFLLALICLVGLSSEIFKVGSFHCGNMNLFLLLLNKTLLRYQFCWWGKVIDIFRSFLPLIMMHKIVNLFVLKFYLLKIFEEFLRVNSQSLPINILWKLTIQVQLLQILDLIWLELILVSIGIKVFLVEVILVLLFFLLLVFKEVYYLLLSFFHWLVKEIIFFIHLEVKL